MGILVTRSHILPLTLALNLCLNFVFLALSGTIRFPLVSHGNSIIKNHSPLDFQSNGSYPHSSVVSAHSAPVVFAMVMYGQSSAIEGLLALKSALMHVSRPVEFHIICSPDAVDIVQEKISLFTRYSFLSIV
jgi:hypothetical protein